jgi:uncharacterized membrane protein YhaH (DUF805 family)
LILFATAFLVSKLFASQVGPDGFARFEDINLVGQVVTGFVVACLAWLSICIEIKRWHDRDMAAWWLFIGFVPVVVGLYTLVECGFRRGTTGSNRFGPDPLQSGLGKVNDLLRD